VSPAPTDTVTIPTRLSIFDCISAQEFGSVFDPVSGSGVMVKSLYAAPTNVLVIAFFINSLAWTNTNTDSSSSPRSPLLVGFPSASK